MEATLKSQRVPVYIEDEMRQSYMDYAMSVIVGRALPDVRDGLKPVHRRVLYAMYDMGNTWDKPYKKSARLVGDIIGKYHPHGDTAVYDTIVRMAQDFVMRYPFIDGQGNFGSVDGDSPAAGAHGPPLPQPVSGPVELSAVADAAATRRAAGDPVASSPHQRAQHVPRQPAGFQSVAIRHAAHAARPASPLP